MQKRRYEILLPVRYNDGRDVEPRKLYDSKEEAMARFAGLTADSVVRVGSWRDAEGTRYNDETIRLTVDVDDTPEIKQAMVQYKAEMIERFQQKEIYIVSYPIEIV
jgi:hypothetical protein